MFPKGSLSSIQGYKNIKSQDYIVWTKLLGLKLRTMSISGFRQQCSVGGCFVLNASASGMVTVTMPGPDLF